MVSRAKKIQKGLHFILDLYGCDPYFLNSLDELKKILIKSAEAGSMEILKSHFHKFEPQGATGFVLLSTSHVSVHTWPEYGYAAFDVFSCSDDANTTLVKDYIIRNVSHRESSEKRIKRGYVYYEYLFSPLYYNDEIYEIKIKKKLAEIDSGFQNIMIFDLLKFGRSLVIDGLLQTSEYDHAIYDKSILQPLNKKDKDIIILGGGDGYVAEMALKINPNLKITVVELDYEVVSHSKKFLNQKIFEHPNVTLVVGDALNYMANLRRIGGIEVDGIVSDLTDNPIGTKKKEQSHRKFYEEVIVDSVNLLKKGGWFSVQAGASKTVEKYLNSAKIIKDIMREYLSDVEEKNVLIPSFGEKNCFLFGRK